MEASTDSLAGRVAVVSGAETPLVAGLARALAGAGATVGLLERERAGALAELSEQLGSLGAAAATAVVESARDRSAIRRGLGALRDRLGPPDVAVYGGLAGADHVARDFAELDDAALEELWERPARESVAWCQATFDALAERGGRIVLVGSTLPLFGAAGFAGTTTTLEAQRVLAKSAARQWGRRGITVNVLATAPELSVGEGASTAEMALTPPALGSAGDPEEDLGSVLVSLAGEGGRFLTGATLCADGGVWMSP